MGANWSAQHEESEGQQSLKTPLATDTARQQPEIINSRPQETATTASVRQPAIINNWPQETTTQLQKHDVDNINNHKSFMVYARDLSITWSNENRYWQWSSTKGTSESIVIAKLVNVCWLELRGKFNTAKLSPGVQYKVAFQVMMNDPAYGWEFPVNLCLVLPDGSKQEHKQSLTDLPKGEWKEIEVGKFRTLPGKHGEIEFSLYEYEGGIWKRGLEVKGVVIQPCN